MLKRLRVSVLVRLFKYYGKKADRYNARMKTCEIGSEEFVHCFNKTYTAIDKRVEVLDKLYALRD